VLEISVWKEKNIERVRKYVTEMIGDDGNGMMSEGEKL
jgi:hypothetical protein